MWQQRLGPEQGVGTCGTVVAALTSTTELHIAMFARHTCEVHVECDCQRKGQQSVDVAKGGHPAQALCIQPLQGHTKGTLQAQHTAEASKNLSRHHSTQQVGGAGCCAGVGDGIRGGWAIVGGACRWVGWVWQGGSKGAMQRVPC